MADLTELSRRMLDRAFQAKSVEEALAVLQQCQDFRTFREILMAADPLHREEEALRACLIDSLAAMHPQVQRDSHRRKVSNWFSGTDRPRDKDLAFDLCMILGLKLPEANRLIMRICEESIHWRDPRDIVRAYAIVHHLTWDQTQALLAQAQAQLSQALGTGTPQPASKPVMTSAVRQDVLDYLQESEEALLAYLTQNAAVWGAFHNRAHAYFHTCLSLLRTGGSEPSAAQDRKKRSRSESPAEDAQDRLTADVILDAYFFRSLVQHAGPMTQVQKSVRSFWPDKTKLSLISTGGADVSRKALIFLHLATCAEPEESGRAQTFRLMLKTLNLMLHQCGYQPLDPRNPFDWMIIFCLCVHDPDSRDERIQGVLRGLFPAPEGGSEK